MNTSNSVLGQNVCHRSWLAGYICWNDMVWQCVSMFVSEWPGCPVNLQSLESIPLQIKYSSSLCIATYGWEFCLISTVVKTGHSPSTTEIYLSSRVCVATNWQYGWLFQLSGKFTEESFVANCMNLVQGDWLSWKSSLFSSIDLWESAWRRRTSKRGKCTLPWFNGR